MNYKHLIIIGISVSLFLSSIMYFSIPSEGKDDEFNIAKKNNITPTFISPLKKVTIEEVTYFEITTKDLKKYENMGVVSFGRINPLILPEK